MSLSLVRASSQYGYNNNAIVTGVPFTFGCWFRADDVTNSQYLMSIGDKDVDNSWWALVLRGDLTDDPVNLFRGSGGSWGTDGTVNAKIQSGRWYLAVCSATSLTNVTLYCMDVSHNLTDSVAMTNWDRVAIGTSADSTPSNYAGCLIGEAFIIDGTALSAGQVAALVNGSSTISDLSPTAYWPLLDNDDDAAGAYDLTLVNSPSFSSTHVAQHAWAVDVISSSNWTGDETAVDEVTYNDTDYVTGASDANGTIEFLLNDLTDPESSDGHTIRIRARKSASAGHTRGITVYLVENATVRATWVASADLSETWTEFSTTISTSDADSITDYADLRLRVTSTGTVSTPAPNRRSVYVSWMQLQVPAVPAAAPNQLTAQDITAGTPTIDAGTIAQQFDLTAQDVASGTPTLDATAIGQSFDLTAQDVTAGTPTVDQPATGQTFGLTAQDITAGTPAVDQATVGQGGANDLTAQDVTAGVPAIDAATAAQEFGLTAQDVNASAPTVDAPAAGQEYGLTVTDLVAAAPTIDAPAIAQEYGLTATDITAGIPTVETPTAAQEYGLTAQDVTAAEPGIDQPAAGQTYSLTAVDITAGIPTIDAPEIGSAQALDAQDITAGIPTIDAPTLAQVFALLAVGVFAGVPTIDSARISQHRDAPSSRAAQVGARSGAAVTDHRSQAVSGETRSATACGETRSN